MTSNENLCLVDQNEQVDGVNIPSKVCVAQRQLYTYFLLVLKHARENYHRGLFLLNPAFLAPTIHPTHTYGVQTLNFKQEQKPGTKKKKQNTQRCRRSRSHAHVKPNPPSPEKGTMTGRQARTMMVQSILQHDKQRTPTVLVKRTVVSLPSAPAHFVQAAQNASH